MTLTLIIVFALIALLLALALVYSQWPRWLKGLLAIAVSGFYFYGFSAAHSMLGHSKHGRFARTLRHARRIDR
jgi:DNA-binding transcriptional regulator of glucitol operon